MNFTQKNHSAYYNQIFQESVYTCTNNHTRLVIETIKTLDIRIKI